MKKEKRYHGHPKREHESHHESRHHMRSSEHYRDREEYAGKSQTNEMNSDDGSMIVERGGMHEMAHMPQMVIMKPYPKVYHYPDEQLMANSDNAKGIDDQMNEDMSGAQRFHSRTKY
jgi:hypothetical protein